MASRKTHIQAHTGTFLRQGSLYDLGKIKAPLLRDYYQASCGIDGFLVSRGKVRLSLARIFIIKREGKMKIKKWIILAGILGIILIVEFFSIGQARGDSDVKEIWSYKTDTTFSISVSEEGNLAFSEGTKKAGFMRIYNRKDNSLKSWKCSSTQRVVVSGNYVFAAYNSNISSLLQIKPSKQLWAKRVDSLNPSSLDYSNEAKCGVAGNIPVDSKGNLAASTIWIFDQSGDITWQKELNVFLTCAIINQKGYVVAAGEKFGPWDENFNCTKGENAVYVFDPSGKVLAHVQFASPPIDVGIDKYAERIAVGTDDGGMVFLNRNGKILWEKDDIGGYIAVDKESERIATTKSVYLVLLNQKGKVLWESQQEVAGGIEGLVVSPNGKFVGISTFDSAVIILDALNGKVLYQTKPGKKVSRISLSNSYAGVAIEGEIKLLSLK
ncbi:hypothetical protein CEE45_16885 [Candidatus Heimdallarchaeota archaeon B3_Heim]|nr:MAG: hypothetical protein CEE45_16885 [Candidatus Heimdallarchaeota archaeon B3_Heim]